MSAECRCCWEGAEKLPFCEDALNDAFGVEHAVLPWGRLYVVFMGL